MGSTKNPATFLLDSNSLLRASIESYSIFMNPSVKGPKFLRAMGSFENEIMVVVLP